MPKADPPADSMRQGLELEDALSDHEDRDRLLRELAVSTGREQHLAQQIEILEKRLLEAETAQAKSQQDARRAHERVEELRASTSWRITAPVRWVSRLLGRR